MSDPYLSEIRMFAFNFAPRGWAMCNGQYLPINENTALYSLLGTTFGGDGRTTFQLPDLRGRVPMQPGSSNVPQAGIYGGRETVTLDVTQIPSHTHGVNATDTDADNSRPAPAMVWSTAAPDGKVAYAYPENSGDYKPVALHSASCSATGGGQPHSNMQPTLAINMCIATAGYYPPRN